LAMWLDDRDIYLGELLRCDGRGDNMSQVGCGYCAVGLPSYRCKDCFSEELYCKECVVELHACNPLHRIEVSSSTQSFIVCLVEIGNRIGTRHILMQRPSRHWDCAFNWATTLVSPAPFLFRHVGMTSLWWIRRASTTLASTSVGVSVHNILLYNFFASGGFHLPPRHLERLLRSMFSNFSSSLLLSPRRQSLSSSILYLAGQITLELYKSR